MKFICFALVLFFSVTHGQVMAQNKLEAENKTYNTKNLIYFPEPDYHVAFEDSLYLVSKDRKYGIIDSTGIEVVPLIYDKIDIDFIFRKTTYLQLKYFSEFFYSFLIDYYYEEPLVQLVYPILLKKELQNPNSYLNLSKKFRSNPLFAAKKEEKYGVINKSNETVVPFQYDFVQDIGQDIFLVKLNGKSGIINSKNEIIVPITCDSIAAYPFFSDEIYERLKNVELTGPGNFAVMKQNNKYGVINLFTQKIIPPRYDSLESCGWLVEDGCLCGPSFEEIWTWNTQHKSQSVHSFDNVLKFKVGTKFGLLNVVTMEEIAPPIYDSIQLRAHNVVLLNGKSALLTHRNTVLKTDTYDEIRAIDVYPTEHDFREPYVNFHIAKTNGKWGVLNENGELATKIEWDSIITSIQLKDTSSFQFIVQRKGKFGVINNHNEIIVPVDCDSISLHEEESCYTTTGYFYLVSRRGKLRLISAEALPSN